MRVECLPETQVAADAPSLDRRVSAHPNHELALRQMGLTTPEAILSLPGEIVSGHPDRHVMQVRLPNGTFAYLKREHRVRTKERFRNWLAGFGWSSKSVREGRTLQEIESRGLPGPEWMAFGEAADGGGFLLLAAAEGDDLRRARPDLAGSTGIARELGSLIAEMHERGVDHPDLFAKHVILNGRAGFSYPPPASGGGQGGGVSERESPGFEDSPRGLEDQVLDKPHGEALRTMGISADFPPTLPSPRSGGRVRSGPTHLATDSFGVTLIDWQRTNLARTVSWPRRAHALAVLMASLPRSKSEFQAAFLEAYADRCGDVPGDFRARVKRIADRLGQRSKYREQRQPPLPSDAQKLVWLDGEALCVVPDAVADLSSPELRAALYNPKRNGHHFTLTDGRIVRLAVSRQRDWFGRLWCRFRGRAWRSKELRLARLLFHLQRHHVAAPQLVAYGQRRRGLGMESFLLVEAAITRPLGFELARADEDARHALLSELADLANRVHGVGCLLSEISAVRVAAVLTVDPTRLQFRRRLSPRQKLADWKSVAESMKDYCGPHEVRWFLDQFAEGE